MSGMVKGSKDLNYNVISKKFKIDLPKCLSVEYVENKIYIQNSTLLRWFVIDLNGQEATVYATMYIENEE